MRWVASRFAGVGTVDVEHTVIASNRDLAYGQSWSSAAAGHESG